MENKRKTIIIISVVASALLILIAVVLITSAISRKSNNIVGTETEVATEVIETETETEIDYSDVIASLQYHLDLISSTNIEEIKDDEDKLTEIKSSFENSVTELNNEKETYCIEGEYIMFEEVISAYTSSIETTDAYLSDIEESKQAKIKEETKKEESKKETPVAETPEPTLVEAPVETPAVETPAPQTTTTYKHGDVVVNNGTCFVGSCLPGGTAAYGTLGQGWMTVTAKYRWENGSWNLYAFMGDGALNSEECLRIGAANAFPPSYAGTYEGEEGRCIMAVYMN